MKDDKDHTRLAQTASALGAGILGFGLGAKWGNVIVDYAFIVIVAGAILHVWGMYIMQMKNYNQKYYGISRALWISAWVCLIILVVLVVYLFITK